ncbi:transmembrane protein [Ceratobasidium sp. AG-Ba]|nr:transmembrane protein [Ceratobasidium sp. AG-Ba]
MPLLKRADGDSLTQRVVDGTYIFAPSRLDGIQYSPQWYPDAYDTRRKQNTLHTSITVGSNLVYFFQGSAVYYFADRDVPHGPTRIYLDNDTDGVEVLSNASTLLYQQLLWRATNLGPGDHQLVISHAGLNKQYIGLDYLLVESDHGFTPQLAGPAASIVPTEAIIVDDNDPRLEYSAGWDPVLASIPSQTLVTYFNNTMHRTNTPGASVTLRLNGTAVWYFTDLQPEHGKFNITVDDKWSFVLYGNTGQQMQQRMIWNVTDLPYGENKVVLTHYDEAGTWTTLDPFKYLPSGPSPPSPRNTVAVAQIVGIAVGGAALLVLLAILAFIVRGRQLFERKEIVL